MAIVIDGNNTPTAGGIGYGDGTELAFTAAGTSGRPVVSGGAGAPTFRPYTLPAADGSANQVLQTNGSGALSFATPGGGFSAMTVVTSTGTFTIPSGKTTLKVTVVGAGGGAAGATNTTSVVAGTNGGNSSIASGTQTITTVTANGGIASTGTDGGAGGTATNGDLNLVGSGGGNGTGGGGGQAVVSVGGSSSLGGGAPASSLDAPSAGIGGQAYGGGGSGGTRPSQSSGGGSGGGGGTAIKYLTSVTPGNTISVTIGTGGAGGVATYTGGAGFDGVVIFEY